MQQLTLRISNLVQDVNSPFSPDRSPLNFCPSAIHGRSTAATMHPHPHGTRIVLLDIRGRIRNVLRSAKYCDNRVCLSVCLSVREHISGTTRPIFANFYARYLCSWLGPPLPAIRYVLPVLWMASYLHITGHVQWCRCNTGTDSLMVQPRS